MHALGEIVMIDCASPAYLRECGMPIGPGDLTKGHWSVGYASSATRRELPWEYLSSGKEYVVFGAEPCDRQQC